MNWYEKQASDIIHIKNFYERKNARADFRLNERVSLAQDLNTAKGVIQRTAEGQIVETKNDGSFIVDFGKKNGGKQHFTNEAASKLLYTVQKSDMRESIRKAMRSQVDESFVPGHRVCDNNGHQYIIEKSDVFGRTFQCMDEQGRTKVMSKHELAPLDESEPFVGNTAMAPGSMVAIRGINPQLNNLRARSILPAEAPGIIGQTGILAFAYYPTGTGTQMYRVILQSGGMKDFSMEELGAPQGLAESDLSERTGTSKKKSAESELNKNFIDRYKGARYSAEPPESNSGIKVRGTGRALPVGANDGTCRFCGDPNLMRDIACSNCGSPAYVKEETSKPKPSDPDLSQVINDKPKRKPKTQSYPPESMPSYPSKPKTNDSIGGFGGRRKTKTDVFAGDLHPQEDGAHPSRTPTPEQEHERDMVGLAFRYKLRDARNINTQTSGELLRDFPNARPTVRFDHRGNRIK